MLHACLPLLLFPLLLRLQRLLLPTRPFAPAATSLTPRPPSPSNLTTLPSTLCPSSSVIPASSAGTQQHPTTPALPATPTSAASRAHGPLFRLPDPKKAAQTVSGLARDSSPLHPRLSSRGTPRACPELDEGGGPSSAVIPSASPPLLSSLTSLSSLLLQPSSRRPQPGSSPRPPSHQKLARNHPKSPQEFFRKNSYAHETPQFPAPSPSPSGLTPLPSSLSPSTRSPRLSWPRRRPSDPSHDHHQRRPGSG